MNKLAYCILLVAPMACSSPMEIKYWEPKPMIEGNRRVDELIAWNKEHPGELPPLTEEEKYEYFIKDGIPLPGSGATVVRSSRLSLNPDQSASVRKFINEQKTKGYSEQINNTARTLLNMPETAEQEYIDRKLIPFNSYDTHLYETKSTLVMDYDYQGVPSDLITKVIGFSPESAFINTGWSGAVEFFIPTFGGVCAYHEINIGLTKSSAYILQENATHLINGKVTTSNVIGSKESGFVYEVEWWDKKFKRTLQCASENYSTERVNLTIELAKNIDS